MKLKRGEIGRQGKRCEWRRRKNERKKKEVNIVHEEVTNIWAEHRTILTLMKMLL